MSSTTGMPANGAGARTPRSNGTMIARPMTIATAALVVRRTGPWVRPAQPAIRSRKPFDPPAEGPGPNRVSAGDAAPG